MDKPISRIHVHIYDEAINHSIVNTNDMTMKILFIDLLHIYTIKLSKQ